MVWKGGWMKLLRWITLLIVLGLTFVPTSFAAPNAALPANSCAVTWQAVTVPDAGNLAAVKAISANDIWVGGDGDFLHWDGVNWTAVAKPEDLTITRISASASNDVWALAGVSGQDWKHVFHWDGSTWSVVASPAAYSVNDIFAVGASDVWIVGGGQAFHWNGTAWEEHSPEADWYPYLQSVTVVGGVVYAGGTISYHVEPTAIYKWDGVTWSVDYTGPEGYLVRLTTVSASTVWALANTFPSPQGIVWNGSAWTRSDLPDLNLYNDIAALGLEDAYVVSKNILHWDGTEWVLNFTPAQTLYGISAVSATDLWAVGDSSMVLHGTSPCAATGCAQKAVLLKPKYDRQFDKQQVTLKWVKQNCAVRYEYTLKRDSNKGLRVLHGRTRNLQVTTPTLSRGHKYYWRVRACNAVSCGEWSYWYDFVIKA